MPAYTRTFALNITQNVWRPGCQNPLGSFQRSPRLLSWIKRKGSRGEEGRGSEREGREGE